MVLIRKPMQRRKTATSHALAVILALMIVILPFENWRASPYTDREVYKSYFVYGTNVIDYLPAVTPLNIFTRELLWHLLVGEAVDHKEWRFELTFTILAFFAIYVFAFFVVRRVGPIGLLLIINPLVIDLALSQTRSAFAFALLYVAWQLRWRWLRMATFLAAPAIHTASIVVLLYGPVMARLKKIYNRSKHTWILLAILAVFLGVAISFILGPAREIILSAIGDRRVEYPVMDSSLKYLSPWILLLMLFLVSSKRLIYKAEGIIAIGVLSIILGNIIWGGYSLRWLALAFPILVVATLKQPKSIAAVSFFVFLANNVLMWTYWALGSPV